MEDADVNAFLISMAANYTTEAVKKLWKPIREWLVLEKVPQETLTQFEADDKQAIAQVNQALNKLLAERQPYEAPLKKIMEELEQLLAGSAGVTANTQFNTGNNCKNINIVGNNHKVSV